MIRSHWKNVLKTGHFLNEKNVMSFDVSTDSGKERGISIRRKRRIVDSPLDDSRVDSI